MNGVASAEERMTRKRSLEAELEVIRNQKAEVLRAIQQISKKQKLGGPPSKNAIVSPQNKAEAEKRHHAEQKKRIFQMCAKIIQELLKNGSTKLYFGEPVHGDLYPGYYDVIKQPRDLGTIKKKLDDGGYDSIMEFRDDIRLCFENCRAFNPVGHAVRGIGDAASDQFEKKWAIRAAEVEWNAEMRRHALAMDRLEAETKSLPDKIKEVDAELQDLADKAAARAAPLPPGPGREMTFEERRKLSHSLSLLSGERLARIVEIVAEGPSAATLENSEELELDLDSLDSDTLWKMQAYVNAVEAEMNAKASRPGPVASPAPAGAPAAAPDAAAAEGAPQQGSDSDEGMGSKGNADSTGANDPTKSNPDTLHAPVDEPELERKPEPESEPVDLKAPVEEAAAAMEDDDKERELVPPPVLPSSDPAPESAQPEEPQAKVEEMEKKDEGSVPAHVPAPAEEAAAPMDVEEDAKVDEEAVVAAAEAKEEPASVPTEEAAAPAPVADEAMPDVSAPSIPPPPPPPPPPAAAAAF